jgi:hypothetical protein
MTTERPVSRPDDFRRVQLIARPACVEDSANGEDAVADATNGSKSESPRSLRWRDRIERRCLAYRMRRIEE